VCDRCDKARDILALAEPVVTAAGTLAFRRPLTPFESLHHDAPRMKADFDAAELAVAKAAAPVVQEMARQLVDEARVHVKAADVHGIAGLSVPRVPELAAALREGMDAGRKMGHAQIIDQHAAETGKTLPLKLAVPAKSAKRDRHFDGKATLKASAIAAALLASVHSRAAGAIETGRDDLTDEAAQGVADAGAKGLMATAVALGVAALHAGRDDALAIPEVRGDVGDAEYSALMDNDTCDACAEKDGETFGDGDGYDAPLDEAFDATPNPDCVGMEYGNQCRCVCVMSFGSPAFGDGSTE